MSTKKKKSPATGVRYSDVQKKEIVNFVTQYNTQNGRGGQSAAASKYNVTPLTISGWLKAAGAKAPGKKIIQKPAKAATKVAKKAATKVAKKAARQANAASGKKGKKGVRYTPEEKKQVVDFVTSYNEANGRGGQNQAANKFKLSVLTVASWLKAAGAKKPSRKKITVNVAKKAAKKTTVKVSGDLAAFKAALVKVINQF